MIPLIHFACLIVHVSENKRPFHSFPSFQYRLLFDGVGISHQLANFKASGLHLRSRRFQLVSEATAKGSCWLARTSNPNQFDGSVSRVRYSWRWGRRRCPSNERRSVDHQSKWFGKALKNARVTFLLQKSKEDKSEILLLNCVFYRKNGIRSFRLFR